MDQLETITIDGRTYTRQEFEALPGEEQMRILHESAHSRLVAMAADGDPGEAHEAEVLNEQIIEHEGMLINAVTGEIVGVVGGDERFHIRGSEDARWVMSIMQK